MSGPQDRLDLGEIRAYLAEVKAARARMPERYPARYPADFDWAVDVLGEALVEVARLQGLLARLEWACACDDGEPAFCPACSVYKGHHHEPTCWLARELGR
jgi:hypothetical protein